MTVTVDGQPLADKLDGRALRVDPGEHEFIFTVAGQTPVTEKIVMKEGEKDRHERVVIGAPPPPLALPPTVPEVSSSDASKPGLGAQKWVGIVGAGAGVVGVVIGGVFGGLTASAINQQKTDCASASHCANYAQAASDHSTWTTDGTISTAAFIAGGVLIAGGAVLFFTAPRHASEASAAAARLVVVPSVGPGGGAMLLRGEF